MGPLGAGVLVGPVLGCHCSQVKCTCKKKVCLCWSGFVSGGFPGPDPVCFPDKGMAHGSGGLLKGIQSKDAGCPQNVENVQMFPAAGFTGYFSSFCVLPFFFSFLNKK